MTIRHKVYITNKKKLRKAYENTVALAWELSSDQPPQLSAWSREKLGKLLASALDPASLGAVRIYMRKPEIPGGKSNGWPNSVWKASENMGCD